MKQGFNLRHSFECLSMLISLSIWFWSKACTNYNIYLHNVMTHFATLLSQQNNVSLWMFNIVLYQVTMLEPLSSMLVIFISPNGTPRFTDSFKSHSIVQICIFGQLDMTSCDSYAVQNPCAWHISLPFPIFGEKTVGRICLGYCSIGILWASQ